MHAICTAKTHQMTSKDVIRHKITRKHPFFCLFSQLGAAIHFNSHTKQPPFAFLYPKRNECKQAKRLRQDANAAQETPKTKVINTNLPLLTRLPLPSIAALLLRLLLILGKLQLGMLELLCHPTQHVVVNRLDALSPGAVLGLFHILIV